MSDLRIVQIDVRTEEDKERYAELCASLGQHYVKIVACVWAAPDRVLPVLWHGVFDPEGRDPATASKDLQEVRGQEAVDAFLAALSPAPEESSA